MGNAGRRTTENENREKAQRERAISPFSVFSFPLRVRLSAR
jgi:hypothetical protein